MRVVAIERRKVVSRVQLPKNKTKLMCIETAVNEDLSPEIASPVMMGLTLIYYLALVPFLSLSLFLTHTFSFFRSCTSRTHLKLSLRLSSHSL